MLGADLQTIGKAKIYQMGMKRIFGVDPELDIQDDYVRVFYGPKELPIARAQFKRSMERKPGAVRGDIAPIVTPYFVKKYIPYLAGALILGYVAGKTF